MKCINVCDDDDMQIILYISGSLTQHLAAVPEEIKNRNNIFQPIANK